jgi:hypothetical protein
MCFYSISCCWQAVRPLLLGALCSRSREHVRWGPGCLFAGSPKTLDCALTEPSMQCVPDWQRTDRKGAAIAEAQQVAHATGKLGGRAVREMEWWPIHNRAGALPPQTRYQQEGHISVHASSQTHPEPIQNTKERRRLHCCNSPPPATELVCPQPPVTMSPLHTMPTTRRIQKQLPSLAHPLAIGDRQRSL